MEIVKAFNENELHTEIVIKGTSENPLFRASDVGNVLEITNIRTSINDFNNTEKVVHTMDTLGGSQQVTFLTEKGLYKVLFKSRKPIAEKFQNWVCDVIKELRLNGIYDLQQQLKQQLEQQKDEIKFLEDKKKQEYEDKLAKQKVLEREKILLKEYTTAGAIFYVIKVKTFENGHYIVKIGESRIGITNRYKEHKSKYPECLLLDCFAVNKSKDFESFIKEHELIKESKVCDLLGHESELELFLIGKKLSYQTLLNIINNNLKYFNQNDTHKLELENEQLKLKFEIQQKNSENLLEQELFSLLKQLSVKIDKLEKSNKEVLEKLNASQTKLVTGFQEPLPTLGPRLQKINPETLELVKVYETVTEAMNENSNIKRPSINKAVVENTIYQGYRWLLVDRELDPNIIHNIQPTKETILKNLGYIAKLNSQRTQILNVYLDRKTAALSNGYESSSALDNPVKNSSITKGYYYMLYNDCDIDLKKQFEEKYGEPILYKDGIGQYNSSNELIKEFNCKYDCIRQLKMSDKTLAKALDKNVLYNNSYFKNIGSKLFYKSFINETSLLL
jgi:prophage antirepressor-like protein